MKRYHRIRNAWLKKKFTRANFHDFTVLIKPSRAAKHTPTKNIGNERKRSELQLAVLYKARASWMGLRRTMIEMIDIQVHMVR
mmetsp:Transcript_16641/g.25361  ORF Transcript_16641/g.25361 Transcript_16641/m.25361 type:complete len:83 (+) Transcript_16641:496-744(+)